MNEPHGIPSSLWNEVIARLFKTARSIDTKHSIIAGGADWNAMRERRMRLKWKFPEASDMDIVKYMGMNGELE